jgi:hypothetical protein
MEGMMAIYEAWKLGDINSASRLLRAKVTRIKILVRKTHIGNLGLDKLMAKF